jgi:hypothetical protein
MLSVMETRRWIDPSQPQTLQIAVFLLYAQAVMLLIFGAFLDPLGLAVIAGGIGAGYGIANEKKWGYGLGIAVAAFPFIYRIAIGGFGDVFTTGIIELMFEVALIVLLLHPQSREYERIWCK